MNHVQAAKEILVDCAAKGIVVFDTMSLRTVFPDESPAAFAGSWALWRRRACSCAS